MITRWRHSQPSSASDVRISGDDSRERNTSMYSSVSLKPAANEELTTPGFQRAIRSQEPVTAVGVKVLANVGTQSRSRGGVPRIPLKPALRDGGIPSRQRGRRKGGRQPSSKHEFYPALGPPNEGTGLYLATRLPEGDKRAKVVSVPCLFRARQGGWWCGGGLAMAREWPESGHFVAVPANGVPITSKTWLARPS